MKCESRDFGLNAKGEAVVAYTMTNDKGASVTVLNYGGIIQSLVVPDREGKLENVVLGLNSWEEYDKYSPFYGCITGRTAGRISGAAFTIEDQLYTLEANDGNNNLHGGPEGLDKRVWDVTEIIGEDYGELALSHTSPHMDQGFPGTLDMVVTYKFDQENALTITYKATTDKATILTLTNHSYFNLTGDPSTTILAHELQIPADKSIAIDETSIPTAVVAVNEGPFDFRQGKMIGQDIDADDSNIRNGSGYDHPFVLNKDVDEVICLKDPQSGRVMTMTTSEQCVVCYTANSLETDMYVYDHKPVQPRGAVCLETQYYPNAINADFLPERILQPGEVYLEATTFKFSVDQ